MPILISPPNEIIAFLLHLRGDLNRGDETIEYLPRSNGVALPPIGRQTCKRLLTKEFLVPLPFPRKAFLKRDERLLALRFDPFTKNAVLTLKKTPIQGHRVPNFCPKFLLFAPGAQPDTKAQHNNDLPPVTAENPARALGYVFFFCTDKVCRRGDGGRR